MPSSFRRLARAGASPVFGVPLVQDTAFWAAHDVPSHTVNQILSVGADCPLYASHISLVWELKANDGEPLVPAVHVVPPTTPAPPSDVPSSVHVLLFAGDVATMISLLPFFCHATYLVPFWSIATLGAVAVIAVQAVPCSVPFTSFAASAWFAETRQEQSQPNTQMSNRLLH